MRALLIAVAALGLLGAAPAPKQDTLASELEGRVAGKAVECVDKSRLDGPQIVDGALIYRESGRRIWRNDPIDGCPGMRSGDTMVIEIWGSQLCRNDHFRTFAPGSSIPGAICRLGSFTPYDKPAK